MRRELPALALLLGCGSDTAVATSTDTAAPPDCAATPGTLDPTAARQFSVVLTVESASGRDPGSDPGGDPGGGAGRASLDGDGVLRWDLAPAIELATTTDGATLTGSDELYGDGSGPDDCAVDVHETATLDATWTDPGTFAGTLTWRNFVSACDATCEVDATYTVTATAL